MDTPTDILMTAARAVEDASGNAGFAQVLDRAEQPDDFPALMLIRRDDTINQQPERGGGPIEGEGRVEAVIFHPVRTVDTDTETETEYTQSEIDALFQALLYELFREDPTDPDTGQTYPQARAPLAKVRRIVRGYRSNVGRECYTLGFELRFPHTSVTPQPLT